MGPHMSTSGKSCNTAKYIGRGTFIIYKLGSCGWGICIYVCESMKIKGTIMFITTTKAHSKNNTLYIYVHIRLHILFSLTELLLRSHGRYTNGQIERCARMCGGVENNFRPAVCTRWTWVCEHASTQGTEPHPWTRCERIGGTIFQG